VGTADLAKGFIWGPPPADAMTPEERAQMKKSTGMTTVKRDIFIARGTKKKSA
jgi:hypothetical protein